jgi:beta-N-acetylhexosaminidase
MPAPSHFWRQAVAIGVGIVLIVVAVIVAGRGGGDEEGGKPPATTSTTAAKARGPAGELSPDELVDTVILAGFDGSDPDADIVGEVSDHRLGGVLIGPDNWPDAKQGTKLIAAIREAGSDDGAEPPLIATVQEGGAYNSLKDLPPAETELEVGNAGKPELAGEWAERTSKALRAVGIDLNLAPVADVATVTSPLAERTFSDDPEATAEMTAAYVRGCEKEKLACAPSHFPGLGAAGGDTDSGPASVGLDEATLESRDLVPFLAAFRAGAPATVVSHAFYATDPVTPGSLSPAIATDLLRKRARFDGVAISDDIGAGAITATGEPADAAVKALAAGIDLVQVADPDEVEPVRRAIRSALEDGTLDESRLREAAGRVLKLQRQYGG